MGLIPHKPHLSFCLQDLREEKFGARVLGAFEEVFRCALLDDAALIEEDDSVSDFTGEPIS